MSELYFSGAATYSVQEANTLLAEFGTRDPGAMIAGLGLGMYYCADFRELRGMYAMIDGRACIFVNSNLDMPGQRLVMAHELGHDRLHRHLCEHGLFQDSDLFDWSSRTEFEANLFAAELLLEDHELLGQIHEGYTLDQLAGIYGYEADLILLKALILRSRGHQINLPREVKANFLSQSTALVQFE